MSEEMVEVVLSHTGQTRRAFIGKLVLGSAAFAVPVVASFTIGGTAAPRRSPIDAGANTPDGGSNDTDGGSNNTDGGPNTPDGGSNDTDGGSNDLDGGSNDTEGSGVPGGGIPATE